MNFGVTALAAPNSASFTTARYSATAWLRSGGEIGGTFDTGCGRWHRPGSSWHRWRSLRRRRGLRRCSAATRSRTTAVAGPDAGKRGEKASSLGNHAHRVRPCPKSLPGACRRRELHRRSFRKMTNMIIGAWLLGLAQSAVKEFSTKPFAAAEPRVVRIMSMRARSAAGI